MEDRWFIDRFITPIANACNRERERLDLQNETFPDRERSRRRTQELRNANNALVTMLPEVIQELRDWPDGIGKPEELVATEHCIAVLYEAARRAQPAFERIRNPGGQRSQQTDFAFRIARHLKEALGHGGVAASLTKPDAPIVRFVSSAVETVYGGVIGPESLAKAFRRRLKDIRREGAS